jgi:hypothetical protein
VVLDGAVVGKTPWEGTVAAGTHTIALRGPSDEGTAAKPVEVAADKATELSLEATKLPGELRVSPTPPETSIFIDGKLVGTGAYKGEVVTGEHVVMLTAPWHRDHSATFTFLPGRTEVMTVALERIRRFYVELQPIVNPFGPPKVSFAGDKTQPGGLFGMTLRVGLKLHPHVAIEAGYGYAFWKAMKSGDDLNANKCIDCLPGTATEPNIRGNLIDEAISYQGPIATLSGSAHFGDPFPVVLRVTTGLWFTEQKATGGIFQAGGNREDFPNTTNSGICPLVGPEARFGARLSRAITIDLGFLVSVVFCRAHDFGPRTLSTGQGLRPLRTEDANIMWSPTLGLRVEL